MHLLDFIVIGLYAAVMLGIGLYYSRKTRTTEDYMLGGRQMKPWAVGISLFAALLSAISYLAIPGEVIGHGPVFLCNLIAYPFAVFVICYWFIPVFMKFKLTSAYELLEERLGISARLAASIMFLIPRVTWMALLIYLSSEKIIVPALGWPEWTGPWICVAIGMFTVIYTSMGGLRASVLTSVIQTFVLLAGAVITVVVITVKMGGLSWFPTEWSPNWDVQPMFSFDPYVRITVIGIIFQYFFALVTVAGTDQMAIQRYMATNDVKGARRMFIVNAVTDVSTALMLMLVAFALLGFFLARPEMLGDGLSLQNDGDKVFPYFIVNTLPVGMTGLLMSALLAASMSSLSSGINSGCTVIMTDFVDRFRKKTLTQKQRMTIVKLIALGIGVVIVLLSTVIGKISGNIIEVTFKTLGLFNASLFVMFFIALFVRFGTSFGAIWAAIYGFLIAFAIAFWAELTGNPPLSIMYIIPVSVLSSMAAGPLLSLLPTRGKTGRGLAIYHIIAVIPIIILVISVIIARI